MVQTTRPAVLKIATYNLQFSRNTKDLVKNIAKLTQNGVIVFCLQEFVRRKGQEQIGDKILETLGSDWSLITHLGTENTDQGMGTAILWNTRILTLTQQNKILLPKRKKMAFHEWLFARLTGGKGIPFKRRATIAEFSFQGKPIRIVSVHLDNIGGKNHRKRQLEYVLKQLKNGEQFAGEIVAGDFNSFDLLNTGQEKKMLDKSIGENFVNVSSPINFTADIYNTDMPVKFPIMKIVISLFHIHIRRKLDYIWVKNFIIINCKKLEVRGSDHYPIMASLKLEE